MEKVSMIIVTRNRVEKLKTCLKSLKNQAYNSIEIIVVDNNSGKDQIDFLENYPGIHLIKLTFNSYVDALNVGILNSTGKYVAFIDDDTVIPKYWIKDCLDIIHRQPKSTGIIRTQPIEVFGPTYRGRTIRYIPSYGPNCSFIKKEVFEKAGYFDREFGWYLVDAHHSVRVINAGYKILFTPEPIHYHNDPSGCLNLEKSKDSIYYHYKNGLMLIWLHYPLYLIPLETIGKISMAFYRCIKNFYFLLFFRILFAACLSIPYCIFNRELATEVPYTTVIEHLRGNKRANWREYIDNSGHRREFNSLLRSFK